MGVKKRIRAGLSRGVGLLPRGLEQRARLVELRYDDRLRERALAREIEQSEAAVPPANGLPLPPALMRVRVSDSHAGWRSWLESGKTDARLIRELLARNGHRLAEMDNVLDFGCGCGRVARWWSGLEGPTVHGVDLSGSMVRWCRSNLPFMRTTRVGPHPPTAFPSEHFDFVYALSVFTHLPEQDGREWLRELVRILRPGGVLLFTVQGERFLWLLTESERERFRSGRPVERVTELAGANSCVALHPRSYVVAQLPALGVELVESVYEDPTGGEGVSPMPVHDNYLVRKPTARP